MGCRLVKVFQDTLTTVLDKITDDGRVIIFENEVEE